MEVGGLALFVKFNDSSGRNLILQRSKEDSI